MITGKTRLLGIFGHPVGHSLSPVMHNALLTHLNIDAVYVPIPCAPDKLREAMAGFRAIGFLGANVTIPFKEAMVPLVDRLTPIAQFMGSVNTLFWRDGLLWGTTTDPYGALRNLKEHEVDLSGRNVALLGNGGASRALAFALLEPQAKRKPRRVCLFGRNADKVRVLVDTLRAAGLGEEPLLEWKNLDSYPQCAQDFDLLINGTPVGMTPKENAIPVPPESLHPQQVVFDFVYQPEETLLLREARAHGCVTVPGIGMLIHQGALSFQHWFPEYADKVDVAVMQAAIQACRTRL
ncbi:MAG TPA: shikimate dehydrogenase [Fibrobacteraceae bacterium]|nr:shikimate dehydrogenase [Fibrobacteraceae bacterium]